MRFFSAILGLAGFCLAGPLADAALLVDCSPAATGSGYVQAGITNNAEGQVIASSFTLDEDAFITGGSIFGYELFGEVGTAVRFLVFSADGSTPVIDIATTLDLIDSEYTSLPYGIRRHASISPTFLTAGTYWFALPAFEDLNYDADTGNFGDNITGYATPDSIYYFNTAIGKPFIQIEGTLVPEPGTSAMLGIGLGIGLFRRRRNSAATA